MIKQLRDKTAAAINLCKEALNECDGDFEEAELYIRKKDKDKAAKKSERATGEGIVFTKITDDGSKGAMVEIACETDFAAKNDAFQKMGADLIEMALAADSLEGYGDFKMADGKTVTETVAEAVATIGENMRLRKVASISAPANGALGIYTHFNNKSASIVALNLDGVDAKSDAVAAMGRDVCMHITSVRPMGLTKEDIPADVIAKEEEVFKEEVQGKPADIQEKILAGKMSKFFASKCLSEQGFVKDEKQKVSEFVTASLKDAGGSGSIAGFARFELGGTAVCVGGEMVILAEAE
jgi:elongation factor Ts